jgi:hypothetical protein
LQEAKELAVKAKLASGQKKKIKKLIQAESKIAMETGHVPTTKSRQPIGKRYMQNKSIEQQILASGPIFPGKLQECYFEIDDFRIKGVSTVIGDGTFEGFWNAV